MRIPLTPPSTAGLDGARMIKLIGMRIGPMDGGRYRHWDKLRLHEPPEGISVEEWWYATKVARRLLYQELPVTDAAGTRFCYAPVEPIHRMLHEIDKSATGFMGAPDQVTNPETREYYLMQSLMEEAITSSQLEGAATTRKVAKQMLAEGRKPRNKNEQMIYNNYEAMLFLRRIKDQDLTPGTIAELQRILTENAIEDPDWAGRFRLPGKDEEVVIVDPFDRKTLFAPPPADQVGQRIADLCRFANQDAGKSDPFLHPALRAVILHFWLAYNHPFMDGNGRTARALFYWSMARQGYWLSEFISISRILKTAPSRYSRSFLYTETDENDMTYFILSQLEVFCRATADLHKYLERKQQQVRETRALLREVIPLNDEVNHRQLALLTHAMQHPGVAYTIATHMRSHNVSEQTARNDLADLAARNLLDRGRSGKRHLYLAPNDLRARLLALKRPPGRRTAGARARPRRPRTR